MNSQEAVNCLVNSLRVLDPFLSYRVIKALSKMRLHFPHLSFQDETIHAFILDELKNYYEFFTILHSDDINEEAPRPLRLLRQALQERMDQKLERIFRLLGLRYPPKDIYSAYNGIRSAQAHIRASAVEFLDNLLLPSLKQLLFPILEESTSDALVLYGDQHFGIQRKTRVAYLEQLIDGRDEWLQTISLYVAGNLGLLELQQSLRAAASNPNEVVRQTARQSLRTMEGAQATI